MSQLLCPNPPHTASAVCGLDPLESPWGSAKREPTAPGLSGKTMKIARSATCCQELSRRAQDGLKSTQDAAKTAPRALQTLPRRAQELPRRSQLGPKSAQDPSKTVPRAPKRLPIPPRERPKGLQGSKRPPRPPQERPGRLQDRPQTLQIPSQERPSCCPAAFQIANPNVRPSHDASYH